MSRGVDARRPKWRGYHHHRYLVWNDNGVLTFLPKYPIIEYYEFGETESEVASLLNEGPLHWNTYFFWSESIRMSSLCHERDFILYQDYGTTIVRAIQQTFSHHERLKVSSDYRSC